MEKRNFQEQKPEERKLPQKPSLSGDTKGRKVSFSKISVDEIQPPEKEECGKHPPDLCSLKDLSNSTLPGDDKKLPGLCAITEHKDGEECMDKEKNENQTFTYDITILRESSSNMLGSKETPPLSREGVTRKLPRRASSVTSSGDISQESDLTSSVQAPTSSGSTTSYYTNASYQTISTRGSRSDSTRSLRWTGSQPGMAVDGGNRLITMALKREWSQFELTLNYMKKSDLSLDVIDDETGINPFMLASRDNRVGVVKRLIELGVDINDRARDGQSAIHFAVAYGREEIVKILLKKGINLGAKGGDKKQLPLHLSCFRSGNNAVPIAQMIIRETDKDLRLKPDKDGNIPLFLAIQGNNQGACRELLSQSAEEQVRFQNPISGNTILHIACGKRDAEMVRYFIKKGALVNLQNKSGMTALHIAAATGDMVIIEALYSSKADPDLLDNLERTPLQIAAEKGHSAAVELFADKFPKSVLIRTKDGSTLMHIASEHGHPEAALSFLKKGVLLHMPNKEGAVCLHSAAKNNHVEVVKMLLMKGAHVDAMTKDKLTALHVAVKYCRPLVVQMLLGFGAPVQEKGGEKQETPLHFASQILNGEQVAEMLLKSGADVNCARDDGETAIHMAARGGNLKTLKLLLDEGGDCRIPSNAGENALHIAVRHCRLNIVTYLLQFLEKKFSRYEATMCVNMENKEGETSVHLAAELTSDRAHYEGEEQTILHVVLEYGGDVNFCTKLTQETPLHYCSRSGNRDSLMMLINHIKKNRQNMQSIVNRQAKNGWSPLLFASDEGHQASVDILLQYNARVDVFDENGKAALHVAAENGYEVIADMLLRKKAFVNAKTKLGLTPLHLASQKGFNNLVKLLINTTSSEQAATVDALSLDKKTPLHKAAEDGMIEVCETLLQAGADVEAVDNHGQTPLHLGAENDHSDVVKMFLAHRSDLVTKVNKNGATCAHIAASKGSVAVIRELIKSNKESVLTATNMSSNSTALHLAASRGHSEVVRELILNGASLTEEDSEGLNALHLSAKHGHSNMIEVITSNTKAIEYKTGLPLSKLWQTVSRKCGFNVLHIAAQSGNEHFAREMLHRIRAAEPSQPPGVKIDGLKGVDKDFGFTPLHLASQCGHVNLVRMILNYPGVSVDASTAVHKLTPLHLAAKSGFVAVVGLLLSKSIAQLKCADARGFTCLHYAAAYGHLDMASLLFGQGAIIESRDIKGLTPLHLAAKSGSLGMVRLLTDAGASTLQETKHDRRSPIQFATSSRHYDVVSFLLKHDHDTYKLIEDKTFVSDLMLVAISPIMSNQTISNEISPKEAFETKGMEILEEFVLSSSAPLDVAAKLSRAFILLSNREKEQAKGMQDCAAYCEKLAVELLEICSSTNGANHILKATDPKSNPFLDVLIECEQKTVISNPAVQKYLSDIWVGSLGWSDWKLVMLFFTILLIPALWLVLALPFHWRLNQIPIIKFIVYLVSHFYMVSLFVITVAIPITPIFEQGDLVPEWNEWLLLVWVSGVLVHEITSPGRRTGIAQIRLFVLVLCAIAVGVHLIAFAFPYSDVDVMALNERLEMIYIRNMFLSAAMTCSFIQFLEFLSFHYLFGPWSIIIEGLLNDLIKFGVIVLMFIMAFTMWLAAVYQPVYVYETNDTAIVGSGGGAGGARVLNPLDTFQILFFALFGLIEPENLPPINRNPLVTIYLIQIVFGLYHVITLIVLINLLIAMMSDTYQRIQAQSDTEWKFGRAKLIRNMKQTSLSPAPINLLVTAYQYSMLFQKYKCKACDVGIRHGIGLDNEVNHNDELAGSFPIHAQKKLQNKRNQHLWSGSKVNDVPEIRGRPHVEDGRKKCGLETVVDWEKISQKYWEKKGKQKIPSDVFSPFGNDTIVTSHDNEWLEKSHPHINHPDIASNIDAVTERSPHAVHYDDDTT